MPICPGDIDKGSLVPWVYSQGSFGCHGGICGGYLSAIGAFMRLLCHWGICGGHGFCIGTSGLCSLVTDSTLSIRWIGLGPEDRAVCEPSTAQPNPCYASTITGRPEIALRGGGGGDGMGARRRSGGGGFQKWASVPGSSFCVRTDVATKGAGTQSLARKSFFHEKIFPYICVVKMISATWGSF